MQVGSGFQNFNQENGLNMETELTPGEQTRQNAGHVRNSYVEDIAFTQRVLIAPTSRVR